MSPVSPSGRPAIRYAREPDLTAGEFKQVLEACSLGANRPVDDPTRLEAMLRGAGLVVTARADDAPRTLLGVARCLTDFAWVAYLAEVAVRDDAQGLGIGKGLMEAVRRELGPAVSLFLASAPASVGFYERIGMPPVGNMFCFKRQG